jgi:hypothetical protein
VRKGSASAAVIERARERNEDYGVRGSRRLFARFDAEVTKTTKSPSGTKFGAREAAKDLNLDRCAVKPTSRLSSPGGKSNIACIMGGFVNAIHYPHSF